MIFLMLRAHAADREVLMRPIADTYTACPPEKSEEKPDCSANNFN